MTQPTDDEKLVADDVRTLHRLGYAQELVRCLGALNGLGWPVVAVFALVVAAAMGLIASAFRA